MAIDTIEEALNKIACDDGYKDHVDFCYRNRGDNDALSDQIQQGYELLLSNKEDRIKELRETLKSSNEYSTKLVEEHNSLVKKIRKGLPDECIHEHDDVKFCNIRNGEGNECRHCVQ